MRQSRADYILLGQFILLIVVGIITLTSAGSVVGFTKFGDNYFFIKRQLVFGVLPGVIAFLVLSKIDYRMWYKYMWYIYAACIGLLLLVFVPGVGLTINGARSWISIFGYTLQPAELAKLGFVLFFAAYLAAIDKHVMNLKSGLLPAFLFTLGPVLLLVIQPDTGTLAIFLAMIFTMLWVAGARYAHLGMLAGVGAAGLALMILNAPYRVARFMTFLHPELDPLGIGYHINQALLAVGSGGLFGQGFGQSRQKFQYLPEVHSDSIFAVFAEEMGFFFAAAFVLLLVFIVLRCLRLAKQSTDNFGRLIVVGITTWFFIQSFLNIGAMIGILPITGVPLPFVSHGGTALMISMAAVGLLTSVSKHRNT
ncbi:putative lipid II flippase FtsW [Candidatus Nomurabacteria bacterium]|nr:putative lipid II flippase FtsW [Candidatus Nomurabacteria bacterium]